VNPVERIGLVAVLDAHELLAEVSGNRPGGAVAD
jgi:hypothetical protein